MRIPAEVLALLESSLRRFEKLELASYLWRAGAPVPRAELRAALQLDAGSMHEVIQKLAGAKVIEISGAPEPMVRLGPRAERDDFRALMALYAEDRVAVVSALSSIAMHRIRTMAARTFAEAFVLKDRLRDEPQRQHAEETGAKTDGLWSLIDPAALRAK